eukprot:3718236-Pyramimonas_sp.AAC.1
MFHHEMSETKRVAVHRTDFRQQLCLLAVTFQTLHGCPPASKLHLERVPSATEQIVRRTPRGGGSTGGPRPGGGPGG